MGAVADPKVVMGLVLQAPRGRTRSASRDRSGSPEEASSETLQLHALTTCLQAVVLEGLAAFSDF